MMGSEADADSSGVASSPTFRFFSSAAAAPRNTAGGGLGVAIAWERCGVHRVLLDERRVCLWPSLGSRPMMLD